MKNVPGRVDLFHTTHEDVAENVTNTRATRQLADGHVLAAPLQHLRVAQRVRVQQLQQQCTPACTMCASLTSDLPAFEKIAQFELGSAVFDAGLF